MRFAYFSHVWGRPGITVAERYEQLWDEIGLADQLGFDYAFSVEHYCTPQESWMPSPALFCTAAAMRTERIRVGPMGWVPPLRHPLHIVSEVAALDQVLGGRLEVGLASGVSPQPFAAFGADFANRKARTRECAELLQTAFAAGGAAFDFDGEYHQLTDITMSFGAIQRPHPPIWIPTTDRSMLRYLASIGAHTSSTMIVPRAAMATVYRHYVHWWTQAGNAGLPAIGYWALVHVAPTDAEAEAQAAGPMTHTFTKTLGYDTLTRSAERPTLASKLSTSDILANAGDFKFLLDNNLVFVGSPATVADRIRTAATEGWFNTLLGEFVFGDLSQQLSNASTELFAHEVAPQLADFSPY